jgi:hypothetical protein
VVEAAAKALHTQWIANNARPDDRHEYREWEHLVSIERKGILKEARAAIAAAINAWPRAMVISYAHLGECDWLRLPLPQEPRDEGNYDYAGGL